MTYHIYSITADGEQIFEELTSTFDIRQFLKVGTEIKPTEYDVFQKIRTITKIILRA